MNWMGRALGALVTQIWDRPPVPPVAPMRTGNQAVWAALQARVQVAAVEAPVQPTTAAPQEQAQTVHFTRQNREIQVIPGQTLLDAALRSGVSLDYGCQVGGCGHCRIRITSGDVTMDEPNCLSDEERAEGYRLACVSYPCSPLSVDA
ncbi:MAG: 2Fe-2S iron-sulfur cluster binding domain-containing protein [Gammaproteobacteria bacterium]|nr:2Fe-2S iron-sulfur cluster binding domain-containing protein [Gammaproteobacteria bacterium]